LQTSARSSSQLLRALAERALVHNSAHFNSIPRDANSPRHAEGCSHRYSPNLSLSRPTLMHEASKINENNQDNQFNSNNDLSPNPIQMKSFTPQHMDDENELKPSLHQLLLKKIMESDSSVLKKVFEIVSPENTFWNTQISIEELNENAINALIQLFEISKDEYYVKE
jgi:hypothetical protein